MSIPPEPFTDLDWDPARARAFATRAVDLWEELLRELRTLPIARGRAAQDVRDAVAIPVPEEPMPDDLLFDHLREMVFEWSVYPGHPRFAAYITGAGTVPGAAADLLAAAVNMNLDGWMLSPSASEVEQHLMGGSPRDSACPTPPVASSCPEVPWRTSSR